MFQKIRKNIFWLSIANTIVLLIVIYLFFMRSSLIYIDNISVFKEFDLTKELEQNKTDLVTKRIQVLVNLENNMDEIKTKLEETPNDKDLINKFSDLSEEHYLLQQKFDKENKEITSRYEKEIWIQLNQYIKDYGKNKKCKIIFGVSGQGNIMYTKDGLDKTEEIIDYVNKRYRGTKKE